MALGDQARDSGRLLISAPQGRSGKTIVTIGLCTALRKRGFLIQPFKKGPDYIDPSWLTLAAGRSCRNLDLFLIPEANLLQSFDRACRGADVAVIEGNMGLFDGLDSVGQGTSAALACLLSAPVLLVVNVSRMTTSIAAMVSGYQSFTPDVSIAGVILNHVAGPRHEEKLKDAVEKYCRIPVVASIPRDLDLRIDERHLGLVPSPESDESKTIVERIGERLEGCFNLEEILKIGWKGTLSHPFPLPPGERESKVEALPAGETGWRVDDREGMSGDQGTKPRIGVIFDRVFNFYYPENFEALTQAGSELVFINSVHDRLPTIDGLYIGGGFPEFFLRELESNQLLREEIREAIERGLPVYAECAGLMYLCEEIWGEDRSYKMVGTIPAKVGLSRKPQGHGYVLARVVAENPIFPTGLTIRGHEFHHSGPLIESEIPCVYRIERGHGIDGKRDGVVYNNMLASYMHLHALGTTEWAEGFVRLVSKTKESMKRISEKDREAVPGR